MWDFDCVSLYPSAMWDKASKYSRIETGYAFEKHMNEEFVEKFNNQIFNQGSANLKIKTFIVQHLPVKEKEKKIEINRMRKGYITQVLTSVDFEKIVIIGGRVIEIYQGVIYKQNFKRNPFEKVITKLFALRQKYEEKNNDVMQLLVKLIMNALYGEFLQKDIIESYQCKSETWMMTECDERVLEYQKNVYGNYIVKMKDDEGLEDEVKKVNTLPLQLAVFILSNS